MGLRNHNLPKSGPSELSIFDTGLRFLSDSSTDPAPESASSHERLRRGLTYSEKSIILASASARSLAASAVAAGYTPICCDFFGDEDLRSLLSSVGGEYLGPLSNQSDLPPLLEEIPHGIPLFWAGGFENSPGTLEIISRTRPVFGAAKESVYAVRCPENLQRWMKSLPGNFPDIQRTPPADGSGWLEKNSGTSGGLGVRHFNADTLRDYPADAIDHQRYYQRHVDGLPFSAMACSAGKEIYLFGASLQLCGWPSLGAGDFQFCGNLGPVCLTEMLSNSIKDIAAGIASESGLTGVFGMDFLLNPHGLWLLEVNPRIPASHWIYDRSNSGLSVTAHIEGSQGLCQSLKNRMRGYSIAEQPALQCVLYARQSDTLFSPESHWIDHQELPAGIRMADIPRASTIFPAGTPMMSVLAESTSVENLSEGLAQPGADPIGKFGVSWKTIAGQVQEFHKQWQKIIRNF